MSNSLDILTERVDDLPLLLAQLDKMQLATLIDKHFPTHGNWRGLSLGQLTCVWLAHILVEGNHYLVKVQPWASQLLHTLHACVGRAVRELDFTDDRLEKVLDNLAHDGQWQDFEQEFSGQLVRVYDLETERVRIDSTTTYHYGSVSPDGLFQFGHSKDHRPDLPQVKINLATLDALGLPISTTIVSGNRADDGLYLPEIKQVQATLARTGLLFVADCKMGAVAVRAYLQHSQDYYLIPLSRVQLPPAERDKWLAPVQSGSQLLTNVYQPSPTPSREQLPIARGYEQIRTLNSAVDDQPIIWQERLLIVQSLKLAQAQTQALQQRLNQAQVALACLQPAVGKRGKKRYREVSELQTAAAAIVTKWQVGGLVQVAVNGSEAAGGLRVEAQVDEQALTEAIFKLGWHFYVTNQTAQKLSLEQGGWAYRAEYVIEHNFGRLKGRQLSLQPLQVRGDERVKGLLRLLSLGLRVFSLLEYQTRRQLKEQKTELVGLYAGNSKRSTAKPTSESLLKVFKGINLTTIGGIAGTNEVQYHITVLSGLQARILALLKMPLAHRLQVKVD